MAKVPRRITAAWQQKWTAVQPKVAPKGRPGAPRGTQGRPKEDEKTRNTKTHELDESGEGTTNDHRSTATFESRRKSISKVLNSIVFRVNSLELDESDEGTTNDHRSMAAKVDGQKDNNKSVGQWR